MKRLPHLAFALSAMLFLAVLTRGNAPRNYLFAQETTQCNEYNTGAQCGTKTTCTKWRATSLEIGKDGAGIGATCETEVVTYLYLYEAPPQQCCTWCHCPISGGGGGGTSGGSGGGGGSDDSSPCGDPDLWSDDKEGCDQDSQHAA